MFLKLLHFVFLATLLQLGESQNGDKRSTTLNNSSLSLILGDQCVTRTEVETVIRAEVESAVQAQTESIAQTVRNEIQSIRTEMQSLTKHVAEIQNNTEQLIAESPTTGQTTEQRTTEEPLYTCNGTPGWRQVVFINMTDTSYDCPPGLKLTSYSKRTCGRAQTNGQDCSSTTFSVVGSEYSRVCGRIRGYQVGITSAFYGFLKYSQTIDGYYVDGVSLTHGPAGRRQHIWSFAGGVTEVDGQYEQELCPCDTSDAGTASPPFVGNDYFCESGLHSPWIGCIHYCGIPFLDDPLWDGQNCTSTSTCCQLNNPPWFTKTLPNPTRDDIELRICSYTTATKGDSALEIIELYMK